MQRWKFEELADPSVYYIFEINPNDQTTPVGGRAIRWDFHPTLGFAGTREGRAPHQWQFSGVLRSQAQYDAFVAWVNKRVSVRITDDRGDTFVCKLVSFKPTQAAGSRNRHAPWRMTYQMTALIYPGGSL